VPFFNIVAATNENTVVTEYEPVKSRSDSYQSEAELEKEFIRLLCEQGYTYLPIHTEKDLIANLRERLEELNNYMFSDSEWDRFFNEAIANPNDKIEDKTRKIQEDFVQVLKRDDALTKNILLIDSFKKYYMFGFTGTPIFPANSGAVRNPKLFTTEQTFGDQLHTYTIVDAINDKNVLPFRVDYIKTMDTDADIDDEQVWDIDRKKAFEAPERIALIAKYILEHFDQKTYRGDKTYVYSTLTNIAEVASADRGKVEEIKQKQRVSGFNWLIQIQQLKI